MGFIIYFIRQVYKQWFLLFAATIGLASGILTIFPLQAKSSMTNLIVFGICFLVSVVAIYPGGP